MIKESELIINPDGSVYHLKLKPGDIANKVITVGDPDRVDLISEYFDKKYLEVSNREFKTITGSYKGQDLSVISTGIGTDNIDIVLNELDAICNVDFQTRKVKEVLTSLSIIRLGTSGTIRSDVELDSFIISAYAVGLDGLINSYSEDSINDTDLSEWISKHSNLRNHYAVSSNNSLLDKFKVLGKTGITLTANGFYGPQARSIRINSSRTYVKDFANVRYQDLNVTNIEMETAGIYALAKMLGHNAISLSAILANRENGEFSYRPGQTIKSLIESSLDIITDID